MILVIHKSHCSTQVSYIQRVKTRSYGKYCGLAHALELVGERWALVLVSDLIRGPKRFSDLQRGQPRIPSNVLSARLRELEDAGVVRRRVLPRPASGVGYELTEYGRELEDVVLRLGLWGAKTMTEPRPEDIVTADTVLLALRSTFQPEAARDLRVSYELRLGKTVVHAHVDDGTLAVDEGPLSEADLVLETDLTLHPLLTGELDPGEAIKNGSVRITGKRELLERFVDVFHIPPVPVALSA
jgi:DNA-binding HxlR family transcriptional regulator/putative sterol carrier protein